MIRREFINNAVRWTLAGGLVGMTGMLFFGKQVGDPNNCFLNPYCKKCASSNSCVVLKSAQADSDGKEEGE